MLQAVRFTRAMAPHSAGDVRLLPRDLARRLEAEHAVELGALPDHPGASDGGFVPYRTKSETSDGDRRGGSRQTRVV